MKFSALVVLLLVGASVSLTLIGTQHERAALEVEVEKRAQALATSLASAAKEALLALEQGEFDSELTLERMIQEVGVSEGVVAVRLLQRDGRIAASLDPGEREREGRLLAGGAEGRIPTPRVVRANRVLEVAAPILYSGVPIGEAQVSLDLRVLVDPVVQSNREQLTAAAVAVVCLGVFAGVIFVALLVGPLKRLRVGVERLAQGDVSARVPPTSRDEVGELTRAFNEMGDALQQKQRIQNAFGRYVNDYVLAQLLDGPEDEGRLGSERQVTVLFADIRSFTRLSEGMEAPAVVTLLNEIFQLASDHILDQGGTIDKFIGDSVMAYFGAPVPHADHPLRAVTAAIDIVRAVERRNQDLRGLAARASRVPASVGIGIHTGLVVVGNIGSDRRTDFTAIGDAVNVAHRIDRLAGPGEILISEAVHRRVRGAFRLSFRGERQLSGRLEPVHVYSVEPDPM